MSEYDTNSIVKSQRHGHLKEVGRQLAGTTKQAGPTSSTAVGSSTSVLDPTSSQPATIFELVQQQVQGLMTPYHQYLQSYVLSVMPGFQLPPMPLIPPVVTPQQGPVPGQPDD